MKFVNHTEVLRPAQTVFKYITQFDQMAERARERGISVERASGSSGVQIGSKWKVEGQLAGALRSVQIELVRVNAPNALVFHNKTSGTDIEFEVQVLQQAANRTRLRTISEIKARSLSARLVLQSMRLIRPRINARIDGGLAQIAARIEAET